MAVRLHCHVVFCSVDISWLTQFTVGGEARLFSVVFFTVYNMLSAAFLPVVFSVQPWTAWSWGCHCPPWLHHVFPAPQELELCPRSSAGLWVLASFFHVNQTRRGGWDVGRFQVPSCTAEQARLCSPQAVGAGLRQCLVRPVRKARPALRCLPMPETLTLPAGGVSGVTAFLLAL